VNTVLATTTILSLSVLSLAGDDSAVPQEELEARVLTLESQLQVITEELEAQQHPGLFSDLGDGVFGLGPAASKVYGIEEGVSVGGYGEIQFEDKDDGPRTFDAQRVITYVGYRFDEHWVVNTEVELEHASTSKSGSASVEFATLDYLHSDRLNARAGLLLIPMGFVNERHEPTTFLSTGRPATERRIIPSTWRENGIGIFGQVDDSQGGTPWSYKLYAVNGLDGDGFSASGLRGGRQKGSKAQADDIALVASADVIPTEGLTVGGSLYSGDSGQRTGEALGTTIAELHAEWQGGPLRVRALVAQASIGDTAAHNAATGAQVSDELEGHYIELGYDLFSGAGHGQALTPFVRFEHIDTQAGFTDAEAEPGEEDDIFTYGIAYEPRENIVLKLDFEDRDEGSDALTFLVGWAF